MKNCFLVLACLVFSSGCASMSTFNSYTSQSTPYIDSIKNGTPIDLTKELVRQTSSSDKILYLMERGRIAQIQGDFDTSRASFKDAIDAIKANDEKAVISGSGAAAQGSALLVNDNAIPYTGDGYERVMLYHFQAMNYLAKNDVEGAGVEVRRANAEQEAALKRHEKEIQQAENAAKEHKVSSTTPDSVVNAYAGLDQLAGSVKNSFQSAYTFYLSGVVYEMQGQPNDAYIDYKKALEIFPDNIYLQKDSIRLAQQLNMNDDLGQLKTKYPKALEAVSKEKSTGDLIVIFEDDFVPQKEQVKIPIPISLQTVVLTAAAFPMYNIKSMAVSPITLSDNGNVIATSEPICFMGSLAVKALKEKIPGIAIRQVIRSTVKGMAANEAKKRMGLLGSLAASAYNLISENADLRSWTTLPFDVQIMQVTLPSGEHNFLINYAGSGVNANAKVNIKEKGKSILRVIRAGNQLRCINLYPADVQVAQPVLPVAPKAEVKSSVDLPKKK